MDSSLRQVNTVISQIGDELARGSPADAQEIRSAAGLACKAVTQVDSLLDSFGPPKAIPLTRLRARYLAEAGYIESKGRIAGTALLFRKLARKLGDSQSPQTWAGSLPGLELSILRFSLDAPMTEVARALRNLLGSRGKPLTAHLLSYLAEVPEARPLLGSIPPVWLLLKLASFLWLVWLVRWRLSMIFGFDLWASPAETGEREPEINRAKQEISESLTTVASHLSNLGAVLTPQYVGHPAAEEKASELPKSSVSEGMLPSALFAAPDEGSADDSTRTQERAEHITRLPQFTAEASLYRAEVKYGGMSMPSIARRAPWVAPQIVWNVGPLWWLMTCPPPFCGYGPDGRCHCLAVAAGF